MYEVYDLLLHMKNISMSLNLFQFWKAETEAHSEKS